jgi:general stress protein YciG
VRERERERRWGESRERKAEREGGKKEECETDRKVIRELGRRGK